jgi:hypothetical protein
MIVCLNCGIELSEEKDIYFSEYEIYAKAYICECGGEFMTSDQLDDMLNKIKKE